MLLSVVWYCLSFHGFVCYNFLCAEFPEETFVVVVWWSYIIFSFCLSWKAFIAPSILNDTFAG
jgi:hypothetical protein